MVLARTILTYIAAFVGGLAVPKTAMFIPFILCVAVAAASADFYLHITTGRGIFTDKTNQK